MPVPPHPPSPSPSSPISSVHSDDDSLLDDGDHPWTLVDDGTSVGSSLHSSLIGSLSVSSADADPDADDGRSDSGRSVSSSLSARSHSSRDSLDLVDARLGLGLGRGHVYGRHAAAGDDASLGASYVDAEASVSSLNTLSAASMAGPHPLIMPDPLSAEASFVSSADGTAGSSTPGQSLADLANVPHVRDAAGRAWLRESTLWAPIVDGVLYQASEPAVDDVDHVDAVVDAPHDIGAPAPAHSKVAGDDPVNLLGSLPSLKEAFGKGLGFSELLELGPMAATGTVAKPADAQSGSATLPSTKADLAPIAARLDRQPATQKTYAQAVMADPPTVASIASIEKPDGIAIKMSGLLAAASHPKHMKRWSVVALASLALAILVKVGPGAYYLRSDLSAPSSAPLVADAMTDTAVSPARSAIFTVSTASNVPDFKLIKQVLSTLKPDMPAESLADLRPGTTGAFSLASAKLKSSLGQKLSFAPAIRPDSSLSIQPEPAAPRQRAKGVERNASLEKEPVSNSTTDDLDYVDASILAVYQYADSALHVLHDVYDAVYVPALQELRREYARLADFTATLDLPTRTLLKRAVKGAAVVQRRTANVAASARDLYRRKLGRGREALADGLVGGHVERAVEHVERIMSRAARSLEAVKSEAQDRLGGVAHDAHEALGAAAHGTGQRVEAVVRDVGQRVEGVVDGSIASVYQARRGLDRLLREGDGAFGARADERVRQASRRRSARKARRADRRRGGAGPEAKADGGVPAEAKAKAAEGRGVARWLMEAAHHGALQLVL